MSSQRITENTVYSHSICSRKAYLLFYDYSLGVQQDFAKYIDEKKLNIQRQYLEGREFCQYDKNHLTNIDITLDAHFGTSYGQAPCCAEKNIRIIF